MSYFVLGDEETVLGFSLVGAGGQTVKTREQASAAFDDALTYRGVKIIIITESVADLIREKLESFIFSENFPLIVEIPGKDGHLSGKKDLRQMVKDAIGIKI